MKETKLIEHSSIKCFSIAAIAVAMFMTGCGRNNESVSTTTVALDYSNPIKVSLDDVNGHEKINLSDVIDKLEVVKMDNSIDAMFKNDRIYLSDNYIVVKDGTRDKRPAKIFDKKGRYIAPVGGIGRGPGEYLNVSDVLIDEKNNSIYLAQISSQAVNRYDLNGNFVKEIKLGTTLNKPRLFNNGDGTISIVNLCFNDKRNAFVAATVNPSTNERTVLSCLELGTDFENEEGAGVGFNHEVFSYRNTTDNTFKYSYNDNLLKYNPSSNSISSVLEFTLPENMKEDYWCVYNELPDYILVHIVGPKGKTIKVSKHDDSAVEIDMVNDLFGGIDTGMSFQDGHYFKMYEPRYLKECVNEFIKANDVDAETESSLMQLIDSIDDDDNNILLIGKLK